MKILVVDNNKNDRMLISKMLRAHGYEVLEARNGVEALRLLEDIMPDMIISNISMPGMDGFTLLLRLKKNSKTNIIPFVFYTETYVSDEDRELGLSLGASRYLLRPLEPKEFFSEIEAALKEFKAGELKPERPKITEEEYLEKYSRRISQTLDSEIGRIGREIERGEEQFRSASLYARSLIEASLDSLVTIDRNGKIMDVNKATEDVTGVTRDQLIGTDFSNYFTKPEKAREVYKEVFSKGFVRDYPLAIRHTSGSTTDVLYNATVYMNERGVVEGVFAAARDITERLRAEDAMKFAKEEAQRASRIKSEILEKMSHELRTSLNAILPLSIESFNAPEEIDKTLVLVQEKAVQKNIIINTEIDPELNIISADKIRFKQILLTLLDNAIKFSKPQGGTILIAARKVGDMAQFSICDTGIGIREESKYGEGSTFTFTIPLVINKEINK